VYYACTLARFVLGWRFQVIRPAAVRIPQLERPPASLTDSSFQVTGRLQDVLNGDPKEGVQPEMFIPYTPTLRIGPDIKGAGLSQTWRDSRHLSPRVNEVDKLIVRPNVTWAAVAANGRFPRAGTIVGTV
jgi:hypothetical protein